MATAKWKSSSARTITKVKRSQFIVATLKRLRLYSLSLAAHESWLSSCGFAAYALFHSTASALDECMARLADPNGYTLTESFLGGRRQRKHDDTKTRRKLHRRKTLKYAWRYDYVLR